MNNRYTIKTIKIGLKVREPKIGSVSSPTNAAELLKPIFARLDADQEHFVILATDVQNVAIGYKVVASGCVDQVIIDPKILFRNALFLGAVGLLIAHNHPSGNTAPSEEDKQLTTKIKEACRILDLSFLDHLVMGKESHFSFTEHGL